MVPRTSTSSDASPRETSTSVALPDALVVTYDRTCRPESTSRSVTGAATPAAAPGAIAICASFSL